MDVQQFLKSCSSKEVGKKIADLAERDNIESISILINFLEISDSNTYDKHVIPYLVCRALLWKGKKGVDELVKVLGRIEGYIYPQAIIRAIWSASRGKLVEPLVDIFGAIPVISPLDKPLSEETIAYAKDAFFEIVIKSHTDSETFYRLVNFMYHEVFVTANSEANYKEFHEHIFNVLSDSTIKISKDVIQNFERIVYEEQREEVYQQYIKKHPVLINPLATRVVDKHRLGDDYITDFVLEMLNGEYLLVEIEKPHDTIFTQSGDFSSHFSHAFGQVLDFIEWVESNLAYAEKKLPGIVAPKGILIMGLRKNMTSKMQTKLRRFNKNSNSIQVRTYDDVIDAAYSLYKNIRKQIRM